MARDLGVPYAEKQPYYFISYNSEDEKRVAAYAAVLAKHKVPMWYDNGIEIGSKFEMKIAEKIDKCEAVIMFLSKNIFLKESSYVHKEFRLATEGSDKTVFPVILDELKLSQVPTRYRSWWIDVTDLQCINAYDYASAEESMQKLLESAALLTVDGREMQKASGKSVAERIRYENGDVYEGETQDGQPHGRGKYVTAAGDVYEGEFVSGKRHGKGRFTWTNGNAYEGDYVKGERQGKGTYTWENGDVYEGDFASGKGNGTGKRVYANGDVYEGAVRDGLPHGKGKIAYANGDVYEGDFSTGVAEGLGRYTYANGDMYEGAVSSGFCSGYGKMLYANGDVYEGNFLLGGRSGVGKMTYASGRVEEGTFMFDMYAGK